MAKSTLLIFTNLYPSSVQPTKAMFNFQQYKALAEMCDLRFLVPVPWLLWFKHRSTFKNQPDYPNATYFPFFYVPGVFRGLNSVFMLLSVLICPRAWHAFKRAKLVLSSWAFPDGVVGAWLKKRYGFRLFIQCLGSDINMHQQHWLRRIQLRSAFKKADGVVTVSQDLAQKVTAIEPSSRVRTIYNGVDFQRFPLISRTLNSTDIVFIGNMITTKGVFELLQALKLLATPEIRLHMVGSGPELKRLKVLAEQLGISGQITFHGALPHADVATVLHQCKLLVLPSYREGVPNVIMESLASGIPVVATRVGGIPEVVSQQSGILIDSYQPTDIAHGIQTAISAEWEPAKIRHSVAEFTWAKNSQEMCEFLGIEHAIPE